MTTVTHVPQLAVNGIAELATIVAMETAVRMLAAAEHVVTAVMMPEMVVVGIKAVFIANPGPVFKAAMKATVSTAAEARVNQNAKTVNIVSREAVYGNVRAVSTAKMAVASPAAGTARAVPTMHA